MDFFLFSQITPLKDCFVFLASLDRNIFNWVNNLAGKYLSLDTLAIFFAQYFEYILIFFLFLFLIKNFKKYWPMVVQSFSAAFFSRLVIVNIIRWLWPRPRPFIENDVILLLDTTKSASFPSGHAAFYFAIAAIVYFYNKKAGILFFLASFLISISRVFTGIHWPSDIIAGAFVGIFSGWLINYLFREFFKK